MSRFSSLPGIPAAVRYGLLFVLCAAHAQDSKDGLRQGPQPALTTEVSGHFEYQEQTFDFIRRDEQIPMRDGATLHTVILIPKSAQKAGILLTRTPFDANRIARGKSSAHLAGVLQDGIDNVAQVTVEGGYIRVIQDIRGRSGSSGDSVITRPLHGPQNSSPVDESTDSYDTIDWLVKNLPQSNGKVGILGTSYDGYLTLMATVHPHPALKVAIAQAPMVDGWMGDDWFHYGAFRQPNEEFIYTEETSHDSRDQWWTSQYDTYQAFLDAGSAAQLGKSHGLEQLGFWQKILAHPSYDSFWQEQAVDKILAREPLTVPLMLVHGLWDQEDIYGPVAVYKAIKSKDVANKKVFLVIGPWFHGQEIADSGLKLGALNFHSETAQYYRQQILAPFLARYLKESAPEADIAPVNAFQTGTNVWLRLPSWPSGCEAGCSIQPTPLYLNDGLKLSFLEPTGSDDSYEEYVSDPRKPVPYQSRPIPTGDYGGAAWERWLVDDQRNVATRPDVISFVSDPLTEPLTISGQPEVNLVASTSGSDSDWVVKLIDVYPDEVAQQPEMGGYQLMVAADIFRGRYRESFEKPQALEPNVALTYRFKLPTANHVFLAGHRLMVQIQSTWFPLYDRNPQKFVPNIFLAQPADYEKATQRIYHSSSHASSISLPVVQHY
jgi:uncharacterized protein